MHMLFVPIIRQVGYYLALHHGFSISSFWKSNFLEVGVHIKVKFVGNQSSTKKNDFYVLDLSIDVLSIYFIIKFTFVKSKKKWSSLSNSPIF